MGVIARWSTKLKERQAAEAAALKAYRDARAARKLAERVIKRHQADGPRKALAYAQRFVGTKESPPNSNRGPQIDRWETEVSMVAQPWCGAFVHACLAAAGVKGLSDRMRFVPFIVEDARAGVNGLGGIVSLSEAKAGDLVIFQWDTGPVDHVGLFVAFDKAGNLLTVEGNTSAGNAGSQSDGGMVANRIRNRKFVAFIVRPRYPA